jgi:poly-gamma-glutamate synthesis protein (capsule biosynthesis protein)
MRRNSTNLIFTLVILSCLFFVFISQPKIKETRTSEQAVKSSEIITLLATGDILMHNTVIAAGLKDGSYKYEKMFEPIKNIVASSDYAMINLEAALAGPDTGYTGYPLFNAPDSLAEAIRNTGFDLVTNANNHILDRGYSGAMRTLDILKQNGLDTIGINKSQQDKDTMFIKDIRGVKVGFLAYGYDTNGIPLPPDKPYFYNLLDEENILKDITAMRPKVDILVLSLHWGVEYSPFPTEKQSDIAKKFFAQGADVIFGGHPHVLQPAEIMTINGNKKFIVYSMGNCLGDQNGVERNSGVIVKLTFKKDLLSGKTELQSFDYTPTFSNSYMDNGKENFRIIPIPETIQRIKAGKDPYLHADSIPLLEDILKDCDEKMSNH